MAEMPYNKQREDDRRLNQRARGMDAAPAPVGPIHSRCACGFGRGFRSDCPRHGHLAPAPAPVAEAPTPEMEQAYRAAVATLYEDVRCEKCGNVVGAGAPESETGARAVTKFGRIFDLLSKRDPTLNATLYEDAEFATLTRDLYVALHDADETLLRLFAAEDRLRYGTPYDPTGVKTGIEIKTLRAELATLHQQVGELRQERQATDALFARETAALRSDLLAIASEDNEMLLRETAGEFEMQSREGGKARHIAYCKEMAAEAHALAEKLAALRSRYIDSESES